MNQIAETHEMEKQAKQGWVKRLAMAVVDQLVAGFFVYEIGATPCQSQMFMNYSSYGWEEAAMAQSITRLKMDDEV